MHDDRVHPLLAQVPLTVSPFIHLPTAPTLPYTYKALPTTLPPSSTGEDQEKAPYVTSSSGASAHPSDILESCKTLLLHIQNLQSDAEKQIKEWEDSVKERELAEKRRKAPGWLDREEKILEPAKRAATSTSPSTAGLTVLGWDHVGQGGDNGPVESRSEEETDDREGEELDRAFGRLGVTRT